MLTPTMRRAATAFVFALVFLSAGLNAPFIKDQEPQSAQWVVDIVTHHHWLLPYDYYGYIERKPPLFYWLSSLAVMLAGGRVTEALARVPSLIAGAVLAAEVMVWTTANFDETTGALAYLFLLGMYGFASRAALALTDMLMTCLMLSGYWLLQPLVEGRISARRMIGAGVIFGLGILTKGPVALLLAAVAVAIYLPLTRGNPLRLLRQPWPWTVLALALAIASLWYVPAFLEGRKSDLIGVFTQENLGHFLPATMGGTGEASRPFYYVAARLAGETLPLCLLLPAILVALPYLEAARRRALMYQAAMVLAVLLVFSLASAKRDDYILPAIPPLAIMIAASFDAASHHREIVFARRLRDAIAALVAIASLAGILVLIIAVFHGRGTVAPTLKLQSADASFVEIFIEGIARRELPFLCLVAATGAGAIICLYGCWHHRDLWTGASLALIALAMTLTWTGLLKPREAETRSIESFAASVRARVGGQPLYLPWQDPEFSYYYGTGVPALPHMIARDGPRPGAAIYFVARPAQLFVLAPNVEARATPLMRADVAGGGGPPTLYRLNPAF
jgi:4-amino-4-deoxy-L-arabinose transferase-like glycosyltransferase